MTLWPDGTRKLTNIAIREFQYLGVSNTSRGSIIPVMNTAEQGSHWTFNINSSPGNTTDAMQAPLPSVAVSCERIDPKADADKPTDYIHYENYSATN